MSHARIIYIMLFASLTLMGCQSIEKGRAGSFIAAYPADAAKQSGVGGPPAAGRAAAVSADVENAAKQLEALKIQINQAQDRLALKTGDLYEVKKGDTLCKIAGRPDVYNNKHLWVKIWSVNRDIIKNQNTIYPGQMLIIRDRRAR
jgi:nucleoid-associated protein YgaU